MEQHVCVKTDIIEDIRDRVIKLEENDREDYGVQKELLTSIKAFSESNTELKSAIVEISSTLVKVNANLDNLNKDNKKIKEDIVELKNDVYDKFDNLENQFEQSEDKNKIDVREIKKEEIKLTLGQKVRKAAVPFSAISALLIALFELIKGFLSNK